ERHQRQTTGEPADQGLHAAYQTLRRLAGSQNIARKGKQRNGQKGWRAGETIELDHDGRGVNASSPEQEPGEGAEHRKQWCAQYRQEHQQQAQEDHAPASSWTNRASVSTRRKAKRSVIAPNPSGMMLCASQAGTPKVNIVPAVYSERTNPQAAWTRSIHRTSATVVTNSTSQSCHRVGRKWLRTSILQ